MIFIFVDKIHFFRYTTIVRYAQAYALLAQLDRVAHYECEGWGFESLMAHQKSPVIIKITGLLFFADKNF